MLCIVIVVVWLYRSVTTKEYRAWLRTSIKWYTVFFLLLIAWGVLRGLLHGNALADVYYDGNAYVYFVYLPIWYTALAGIRWSRLISIASGAMLWLAIKTLTLLHIFVYDYSLANPLYLYFWLRDTRIAEITPAGGAMVRVFMQSQVYLGIAFLMGLVGSWFAKRLRLSVVISMIVIAAAIIATLSRSYWLGVVVGGGALFALGLSLKTIPVLRLQRSFGLFIMSGVLGFLLVIAVSVGSFDAFVGSTVSSRVDNIAGDAAGASRVNQLKPLVVAVQAHPLDGQGFGTHVSYESRDPRRVTPENPTGLVSTYAFEWGYLDQLVKWGGIAFGLFFLMLVHLLYRAVRLAWAHERARLPALCLLIGLIYIMVVHMVSPYLNHPLGIGYLLLVICFLEPTIHTHYEATHD